MFCLQYRTDTPTTQKHTTEEKLSFATNSNSEETFDTGKSETTTETLPTLPITTSIVEEINVTTVKETLETTERRTTNSIMTTTTEITSKIFVC